MKKRLFSWLLVLAMVLSVMPTVAFAEGEEELEPPAPVEIFSEDFSGFAAGTYDAKAEGAPLTPYSSSTYGVSQNPADINASRLRVFITGTTASGNDVRLQLNKVVSGSFKVEMQVYGNATADYTAITLTGVQKNSKATSVRFYSTGEIKTVAGGIVNAAYHPAEGTDPDKQYTDLTIVVDADTGTVTVTTVRNGATYSTTIEGVTVIPGRVVLDPRAADGKTRQARFDNIKVTCNHAVTSKAPIGDPVEATCTTDGQTAGLKCSGCGYVYEAVEPITAPGHDWDDGVEAEGVITYTCKRTDCGETKSEEVGHTHSHTAVVTAPTCTEPGYTTYTCSCGDTYTGDETDALGHTEEPIPGVEATYVTTGLTEGTKCSVCDEVLVEQEVIPVLNKLLKNESFTVDATVDYDFAAAGAILAKGDAWPSEAGASVNTAGDLRFTVTGTTEAKVAEMKTSFTMVGSYRFYFEIMPRTNDVKVTLPGVTVKGQPLELRFTTGNKVVIANADGSYTQELTTTGAGTAWSYVTVAVDADVPSVAVSVGKVESGNTEATMYTAETITEDDGLSLDEEGSIATFVITQKAAGNSQIRFDDIRYFCDHALKSRTAEGEAVPPTYTTPGLAEGIKCSDCDVVVQEELAIKTGDEYTVEEYAQFDGTAPTKEGNVFAGWYADSACTTLYNGENGDGEKIYAKFVNAKTLTTKVQLTAGTTAESDSTKLRLVSTVDSLKYKKAGFTVNGTDIDITKVYGKIGGTEGAIEFNYQPTDISEDSYAFTTVTLTGFDQSNFGTEFTVTAWWETLDGVKVYGETRTESILSIIDIIAGN